MSDKEANRDEPESSPAEHLEEGELDDDDLDSVAGGFGQFKGGFKSSKLQGGLSKKIGGIGGPVSGVPKDP